MLDKIWNWIVGLFSSKRLWRTIRDIRDDILEDLVAFGKARAKELIKNPGSITLEDYPAELWRDIEQFAEREYAAVILPAVKQAVIRRIVAELQ